MLQSSDDDEKAYGQKEKGWMLGERARFKLGLMALGYGRWQEIKTMARITRWSVQEIATYGKAFLSKVILFAEVEDPKVIDLIQNSAAPKGSDSDPSDAPRPATTSEELTTEANREDANVGTNTELPSSTNNDEVETTAEISSVNFERDPSLCDAKFQEYLQKNAKQVIRRLETLASLRDLVQSNFAAMDEIEVPDSPAPWWGVEEDRSLLLGTHKHGFGRYEEIRNDPSLCFAGRDVRGVKEEATVPPVDQPNGTLAPTTHKDVEPQGQDTTMSDDVRPLLNPTIKTEPGGNSAIKTEAGYDDTVDPEPSEATPKETVAPSQGSGSEEPKLVVTTLPPPPPLPDAEGAAGLVWPSSKILSHRVKRILRSLDTVKRQLEKDTKKVCIQYFAVVGLN